MVLFGVILVFGLGTRPIKEAATLTIKEGSGLRDIARLLKEKELISSEFFFKFYAVLKGRAAELKPGNYIFNGSASISELVETLVNGVHRDVEVTIPEGSSVKDIDVILSKKGLINSGELIDYSRRNAKIEGFLFPDTYRFAAESKLQVMVEKMVENFNKKAAPVFAEKSPNYYDKLILASLLEKEAAGMEDREIIAGILLKRLKADWPLQVDATICYLKPGPCYPLGTLDFKIDSPYNTYVYRNLPPSPIANPGLDAISAALNPQESQYWYYLSDPKTGKTIFSETLEEQTRNKFIYLKS